MEVHKETLTQAVELYLAVAYPNGAPAGPRQKLEALVAMPAGATVPEHFFEPAPGLAGEAKALRLGQPLYPHMKLIVERCGDSTCDSGAMLRVDTHDKHLHAPPGSPDAEWLQKLRDSNKALTEKIEGAWMAAGLPTFKGFLRAQLEARKRRSGG